MIGTCKLCGATDAYLPRSHIIPRALYGDLSNQDPNAQLKLVPSDPERRAVRSPIGVYDRILCEDCEKTMAGFDDYAIRVLRDMEPSEIIREKDGSIVGYVYRGVNLEYLLLYSISLIWRAHVSTHNFFNSVRLGPHEVQCRKAILKRDVNQASGIDAVFGKFDDARAAGFINPYEERFDGVRLYRFSANQLTHGIKVDKLPLRGSLQKCSIRNTDILLIMARVFENSPEYRFMKKTVKARPSIM